MAKGAFSGGKKGMASKVIAMFPCLKSLVAGAALDLKSTNRHWLYDIKLHLNSIERIIVWKQRSF